MDLHTPANAVPNVDGTDLGDLLEDLAGIHPGIDLIRDGLRLIAHDRHTVDRSQTLAATLGGLTVAALGLSIGRLSNPDTNPCLRELPLDQQKHARLAGERTAAALNDPDLHQYAYETAGAIDGA
ncbi:hypothetical protein AB0933_32245 [Streptomyces venezuelae]|uniref:hypothetical protein n=1 Tax=Streptomyces venezuelae TaxID=54571 RepID=UPI0034543BEC